MIPQAELLALRSEWQLRADVIEKDYVLGWLLAGIANEPELSQSWIFKGGTCLRKCYFETYRLSEDLDFTVVSGGPEEPADLHPIFMRVAAWLRSESGLELEIDEHSFFEINYIAKDGRRGPRVVEPYSLRRTKDGHLLLFVVNDRGQLRAYRVDRITGIRPTGQVFQPRYLVEF